MTNNENQRQRLESTRNMNCIEMGKVPPQATDLEEVILGAMLLEKRGLYRGMKLLRKEMFYKIEHQKIFEAMSNLFAENQDVDILTVTNELKNMGELEMVGGAYGVTLLTQRVSSSENIETHAGFIIQKWIAREGIRIGSVLVRDLFEDTAEVTEVTEKRLGELLKLINFGSTGIKNIKDITDEVSKTVEKLMENEGEIVGIPTGLGEVDRLLLGLQPPDNIVIAARPGMGKTALMITMLYNIAVGQAIPVAVFSLEMSSTQLVLRLAAIETNMSYHKLRSGNLSKDEKTALDIALDKIANSPIYIDDTPAITIMEIRARSMELKHLHNIQLVMVDYLQLMGGGGRNQSRENVVSEISRGIKGLAKELDIPVVPLSQLSRKVEDRGGNQRPKLADLRESGAIEQDADTVIFIYRPEYYGIKEDAEGNSVIGEADLIVAKHRNGPLATIETRFIGAQMHFVDSADVENDIGTTGYKQMEIEEDDAPF